MSWLKTVRIKFILKLLSPHQYTKEHGVSPHLGLKKILMASFDRTPYIATENIATENTNIPFKIYLNFPILITDNV